MAKALGFLMALLFLSGCQISYLLKSTKGQVSLWTARVDIQEALSDPKINDDDKRKLRLAENAREFAEAELHLKKTKNYTQYVQLDRPYVTYVVSAAPAWELKPYEWYFPIVGHVPYKGYFTEADAQEEQRSLQAEGLDTYLRGVSAYSTLGWFRDPILSSMLRGSDHDLVNTIIHESVHATLYIKSSADFNERLAMFLGNIGTEIYYQKREGPDSATLSRIHDENGDDELFSKFMTEELKDLEDWYKSLRPEDRTPENKMQRLSKIKERFRGQVQPLLKSRGYSRFADLEINNASLMVYKTYLGDLHDFAVVFEKLNRDFERFLKMVKSLESDPEPEKTIKRWAEGPAEQLLLKSNQ